MVHFDWLATVRGSSVCKEKGANVNRKVNREGVAPAERNAQLVKGDLGQGRARFSFSCSRCQQLLLIIAFRMRLLDAERRVPSGF